MQLTVGLTADVEISTDEGAIGDYSLKTSYPSAIASAGGLPVILPHVDTQEAVAGYLRVIDALVVTGGAFDVPPDLYGAPPAPGLGKLKPGRTGFELALLRRALDLRMPVLGVCGGMQLLNVALGGTLYQDIVTELPGTPSHEQSHDRRRPAHEVAVEPGSLLASCVKGEAGIIVNSTHHQAVKDVGEGLVVSGRAPDGVIEAIEAPGGSFVLGVQWHPEALAMNQPEQQAIYDALVKAAGAARRC